MNQEKVLYKPVVGWTKIQFGTIETPSCSYLTDVPMDIIGFFNNWFAECHSSMFLDYESKGNGIIQLSGCTFTMNNNEGSERKTYNSSYGEISEFAEQLSKNILDDLDLWSIWHIEQYDYDDAVDYDHAFTTFIAGINKLRHFLKLSNRDVKYCNIILEMAYDVFKNSRKILMEESYGV